MQRQPAADRDTNSGHGALDGGHKPTDDDVEAQQQIRNAVAPECTDGVGDELIARVRKVRAHDLRREEKDEQKQRRREDADGRERVAQKFLTARVILFAVVIAHKRLRTLRDADHEVNDNGRHVGDDRVGHDAVRADALEHRAVEEEDHQPRAQLCHAVGQADGQDARVKVRVEAKFAQPERALLAEKVDKVRDTGHELRDARGDRRAEHAHVEVKNGDNGKNVLSPDDMLELKGKEISIKKVDVFEHICWKDNLMLLNDRKVGEVLNRLSRYYGRTILFGKEIGEIPISGKLELRENLEEVVEIICQSLFLRQERDGENNIILLK